MVPDCENSRPSLIGSPAPAANAALGSAVPAAVTNPEPTADRKVRLFICFTPTWIRNRKRKKPETRQAGFGLFWPVLFKTPLSRTAKWMLGVPRYGRRVSVTV